jgi:hypothetical protein
MTRKSEEATSDMKPQWESEIRQRLAGLDIAPTLEAAIVEELAQYLDDHYAESLGFVFIGIVVGLGAALATTRFVSGLLYGLTLTDPVMLSLAVLVLVIVAALAGYLPVRRAARVDPLVALRHE